LFALRKGFNLVKELAKVRVFSLKSASEPLSGLLKPLQMIVLTKANELREYIAATRGKGDTIGFVPTMGALHRGHTSLIQASKGTASQTVCSIFVNPAQFNDPNDYKKYPITIEKDMELLTEQGTDILFLPQVDEVYPNGFTNLEQYDLGFLETVLEGKYRPGHFQGVCQVMARLLKMVEPDHLFMGQKDYQQCMVVKRLLELIGMQTNFHVCSTVREADGLAMSSRNMRLNAAAREKAVTIFEALQMTKESLTPGDLTTLTSRAKQLLASKGFSIDYFEIADATTLEPVTHYHPPQNLVALTAAFLDDVRLIDNMVLN
jgi:pantoate--beta-alanine ligase